MRLLATSEVVYVDDTDRHWRFTLSAMNVLARGMYEQLYLTAAREWFVAAIGKTPEAVIQSYTAAKAEQRDISRQEQYEYNLTDSVFGWAMILASITRLEVSQDDGATFTEVDVPEDWKTPDGMMEGMKRDLYFELSVQGYKLNQDVLFDPTDEHQKKRGVIRSI